MAMKTGRSLLALLLLAATGTAALADPPSAQCIAWRQLAKQYKACVGVCTEAHHEYLYSNASKDDAHWKAAIARRKQCVNDCRRKAAPYNPLATDAEDPCPYGG
jgi:hypothetical protein